MSAISNRKKLLEQIQAGFTSDASLSTDPRSRELYQRLCDLTTEVLRLSILVGDDPPPRPDGPIPDLLTNLQIENDNLKAQNRALSEMGSIVEATRVALRQREEAGEADQTAARLPAYATKLMIELVKLRQGGSNP